MPGHWTRALCAICAIWLLAFETSSAVTRLNATLGGSVHFQQFVYWMAPLEWRFGLFGEDKVVAVRGYDAPYCYPEYEERCELSNTGDLRLRNLTYEDEGQYVFIVGNIPPYPSQIVYYWLSIYPPLSAPVLSLHLAPEALINGMRVALECDAGIQNVSAYTFYRDGESVCTEPHVTCRDSYLYFQPITESDSGNYTCLIQNPISSRISNTLPLTVSAQASSVTLTSNTTGWLWAQEDPAYLHCSTDISNASFAWRMDGQPLPATNSYQVTQDSSGLSSTLAILPITRDDTGEFTCTTSNATTTQTSNALNLSVAWSPDSSQISCYSITGESSSASFYCSWRGGHPAATIQLIFNGEETSGQDEVSRHVPIGNELQQPKLICRGDHLGRKSECNITYGIPEAATHNDSEWTLAREGGESRMRVEVTSPKSLFPEFSWFRLTPTPIPIQNGDARYKIESNTFDSTLLISDVTLDDVGNYECRARNIAGTNAFSFSLAVQDKGPHTYTLSDGAIAGIVVGAVAAVALVGIGVFFFVRKR